MNKAIWLNKELNLSQMLINEEYEMLIKYAKDNQQYLMSEWYNTEAAEFQKKIRLGTTVLRYFERHLQDSMKYMAIFKIGVLKGTVENFEYLLYERMKDNLAERVYKKEILAIKHLSDIIFLLETQGVMSHSEICEYLKLKESTLSEIMKKNDLNKLISFSRSGKYKLYRLTDEGRRIGKQLKKEKSERVDKKEILSKLKYVLESDENKEEFVQKIREIIEGNDKSSRLSIGAGECVEFVYKERGKKGHDCYKVLAFSIDNGEKSKNVKVMAEKQKYDFSKICTESNVKKEEVYA